MNESTKRVIEAMQRLPDENQNVIAECIEAMLELSNDAQQVMMECLYEYLIITIYSARQEPAIAYAKLV